MDAAPAPETMDDAAIVFPDAGAELRRIDARQVTDASGRAFERITWSDAYGRRRVTLEPVGHAPSTGAPIQMDGAALAEDPPPADTTSHIPAPGTWTSIGPDGGQVVAINVSPRDAQLLLAGIGNDLGGGPQHSIYRSTDGGATWSPSLTIDETGYYDRIGYQIAFASDGVAYAAVGQGLYRSRDGGVTWERLLLGPVRAVSVDPSDPRKVWVGLGSFSSPPVRRSTDGGATWTNVSVPLTPQTECRSIAFDPARPGVVYIGFGMYDKGKVWFSPDDGVTWFDRSLGLPGTAVNKVVHSGQRLFVALGEWVTGATNGGVYESTDDGLHWLNRTAWSTSLTTVAEDVAVDPADSCTIWVANHGGVLRTTNCGSTWAIRIPRGQSAHAVLVTPGAVYAGSTDDGVLKSTNGAPLVLSNKGIRELNVSMVAANPLNPNELAVAASQLNSGGVHTSLDGGKTWKLEPNFNTRISTVQFSPDGFLHAITDGPGFVGMYRRSTTGAWTSFGPGSYRVPTVVFFDPEQPGLVVAGGYDYTTSVPSASIWRSTNGGQSWQKTFGAPYGVIPAIVGVGAPGARAILASVRHYADVTPPGYILRSTDQGLTWTNVRPAGAPSYYWAHTLHVSRQNPDRVFATAYDGPPGLMRSDDAGRTWATVGTITRLYGLAVHPDDDRVLYGLPGDGNMRPVVRSRDGGQTFQPYNEGIAFPSYASSLGFVDGDCPALLMGNGGGVQVRVADVERPRLSLRVDPNELWPPNHEMVEVHAQVVASDVCDPAPRWRLVSVVADDGVAVGDIEGASPGDADLVFRLRASRAGSGAGRTYAITYEASDESGNTERRTTFVVAPHDQSGRRFAAGGSEVTASSAVDAVSAPRVVAAGSGLEVRFGLRRADRVRVEVFDLLGARVRVLADGAASAGEQVLRWDGRDADGRARGSGVYLVRVRGAIEWSGKVVLMR
jgi:hypothetical protein